MQNWHRGFTGCCNCESQEHHDWLQSHLVLLFEQITFKNEPVHQQLTLLASSLGGEFSFTSADVAAPAAYDGVLAFHKYWGKKPVEPLAFIIERLTKSGDLVIDPFSGSGVTGFAAVGLKRRYLGVDLNPVATRLSSLVLNPPTSDDLIEAFKQLEGRIKRDIECTYLTGPQGDVATHYLWAEDRMQEVWIAPRGKRATFEPTKEDYELFQGYQEYQPKFRSPLFFKNSRINAHPDLRWGDLFTGRALRNLELLVDGIAHVKGEAQIALKLCVTAAMGQMSKMVFAISGRGKTKGVKSKKVEVGSWVIGFWRPPLHFEINVWNCFERKVEKLGAGIRLIKNHVKGGSLEDVLGCESDYAIINDDAARTLEILPDGCADLILTDPPHSDRAPYLELSELWNAILGFEANFCDEIIVSNARDRMKTITDYNRRMQQFVSLAIRKLKTSGSIAIQFNARDKLSWSFLRDLESGVHSSGIKFRGAFPLSYSANSVVQDNRKGALTTDYVLFFSGQDCNTELLSRLPSWSSEYPPHLEKEHAANVG